MAKMNRKVVATAKTHEGGRAAAHQKPLVELERAVATCLLWENTFYEKGNDIAARIADLTKQVPVEDVAALAIKARNEYKLRHVPLFLCRQLAVLAAGRTDGLVRKTLEEVIQRPDEMGEFLSIYWKEKRQPISAQVKKGLRACFGKFSDYQFAKWDRDAAVKLRDVMFLVAPKAGTDRARTEGVRSGKAGRYPGFVPTFEETPRNEREDLYRKIATGTLESAETWEVMLSAGKDKKETWETLLKGKKLGYMALLMNLRNMTEAKVDASLVETALLEGAYRSKALPFRFVAAAKHAPNYAQTLSDAMLRALEDAPKLDGKTLIVVDVSGSMDDTMSAKTGRIRGPKATTVSPTTRLDSAGALAVLLREVCEQVSVYTFSTQLKQVRNFRGLALIEEIRNSQPHGGTYLAESLKHLRTLEPKVDRVIVITDEQAHDGVTQGWGEHGYIINVAPYQPALQTDGNGWYRINGWSERVVDWVRLEESVQAADTQ